MSYLRLPPAQPYHPVTFLERGVTVSFTTPLLAGTRVRPAKRYGLELIVANPSGGRGVYIIPWTSVTALCSPTLHDRELSERIAALTTVAPSTIRRLGRDVAVEGLAGEDAMDAAQASVEHDKGDYLVANYLLLMALVKQVDAESAAPGADCTLTPTQMQQRAQSTVRKIALRLGRSENWVAVALEAIGGTMAAVGIEPNSSTSRLSRLVQSLRDCSEELAEGGSWLLSEDQGSYARMICSVADLTLSLAEVTLAQARALTNDIVRLLRTWSNDPEPVIRLVGRSEWLLDGWEHICLLWRFAKDDARRRAALVEMAQLVPVLPREAADWTSLSLEGDSSSRVRRFIPLNEDWQTGAKIFELISRNEQMRSAVR